MAKLASAEAGVGEGPTGLEVSGVGVAKPEVLVFLGAIPSRSMMASDPIDPSKVFDGGVAIVAATVGPDGRPAITRGWGPLYDAESRTMTVELTAPAGSATLTNLEANGAIAVTGSQPLTYQTVQVKGVVEHVEAPSERDRVRAHEHLRRFLSDVIQLGISGADDLFLGDLRTVTFEVRELYDQTPGPHAGRRLQ